MITEQFKNTDTKFNPDGPIRVESVKVEWIAVEHPDISWLDQTDAEMGEGFEARSRERKESYGSAWEMLGCIAKAVVSRPIGGGARRLETLTSSGLWGIESDSPQSYMSEVEAEQLSDLADHLSAFGVMDSLGVPTDADSLAALIKA